MERTPASPRSGDEARFRMIDVGEKPVTARRAVAHGRISFSPETCQRIRERSVPKGDVLALAEVAGIMAAKNASQTLPLCHPLSLDSVRVNCEVDAGANAVRVTCEVAAHSKTGVEMEALAGVSAALLSVYDLTKSLDRGAVISGIELLLKEGGKSGRWVRDPVATAGAAPRSEETQSTLSGFRASVLTVSDRCSRGEAEDRSGPAIVEFLRSRGATVLTRKIVPDEKELIAGNVLHFSREMDSDLLILTGGTGLSPRDVTPEALAPLWTRRIPGFGEVMRQEGARHTRRAWLSRCEAGQVGRTLVIALPGSEKAVRENLQALEAILPHALQVIRGEDRHPKAGA